MKFANDDIERRFSAENFTSAEVSELRFQRVLTPKSAALGYFIMDESNAVDFIETRAHSTKHIEAVEDCINRQKELQNLRSKI